MRAIPIRLLALIAALAILAVAPLAPAAAQDFPSRPVRFIVPYAAGGSGDLLARLLGNKLASIWGPAGRGRQPRRRRRPDRDRGRGPLGARRLYALSRNRRSPDHRGEPLQARALRLEARFRAGVDAGHGLSGADRKGLAARARSQGTHRVARQKPGELNYASIGIGSAPHLGAELFKSVAKVDITHVPYRGSSAQAITALIAGDVAMFMVGTSTAVPHIKSGALRGLAVTAGKRVDGLADVPTFAEAGLPGVDVSIWFAVLVPGGTPAAIIKKLNADIAQVVADPEFKQALGVRGFEAVSSSPEQLAEFLDKDYIKFRDLISKLGLQVE
jgi:tripartite-type tricarboxylate transporter receptor subunit TctC